MVSPAKKQRAEVQLSKLTDAEKKLFEAAKQKEI